MLGRKVGVSKGHGVVAVAKEFADRVEIDTSHHQLRRKVVPHVVPAEIGDGGVFEEPAPRCVDPIEAVPVVIDEQQAFTPSRLFAP